MTRETKRERKIREEGWKGRKKKNEEKEENMKKGKKKRLAPNQVYISKYRLKLLNVW